MTLRRWLARWARWRLRCGWPLARVAAAAGLPSDYLAQLLREVAP